MFFLQKGEGFTELSRWEGKACAHVLVVTEEFVTDEDVDEADGLVFVEGTGGCHDEGLGVYGGIVLGHDKYLRCDND